MRLFNLPNILTLCNLLCGLIGIVLVFQSQDYTETILYYLGVLLFLSLVFDFLDGLLARALNQKSEIGTQLDSLADLVSFGVLPGLLVFNFLFPSWADFLIMFYNQFFKEASAVLNPETQQQMGMKMILKDWLLKNSLPSLVAFLIPLASALRLAKFNVFSSNKNYFLGMATPANTILIYALVMVINFHPEHWLSIAFQNQWAIVLFVLISCLLLLSNIKLFSFKIQKIDLKKYTPQFIFLPLAIFFISYFLWVGLFFSLVFYVIISLFFQKKIACH